MRDFGTSGTSSNGTAKRRTWGQIREQMVTQYSRSYTSHELRMMEVKWRRIFAEAGWSVKGE